MAAGSSAAKNGAVALGLIGNGDDTDVREARGDEADGGDDVGISQGGVQQDDIGRQRPTRSEALVQVGGLPDHVNIALA